MAKWTLTLFGPSDIRKYAPYGDKKRHPVVVARDYDCLHCNRIRKPPKKCFTDGVAECMRRISIDDCMTEIKKLLR